jgi:NAD+ kinase
LKRPAKQIKRVGIIGNSQKVSGAGALAKAARLVQSAGREIYSNAETARLGRFKARMCADAAAVAREVDLLLVFGGDGTMLGVARDIAGSNTPMLGINIGGLGFLTAVPSAELARALKQVWQGDFTYETRTLLKASARTGGEAIKATALNDIVISRGVASRLIELEVRVDGDPLTRYRCDGLIISSPTGSTAYSLAAGGAVVFPTAQVTALTPICPHTLSNRSLIVPLSAEIQVRAMNPKPATVLSADGQTVSQLAEGDVVTVNRSKRGVHLVRLAGSTFCETLRRKLHWRGANL